MNAQELKQQYANIYGYMTNSKNPENMIIFGSVMTEMFMWMADNKPDAASDWLEKLLSIRWHNYLTQKEADNIVANMDPQRPWSREQWKQALEQHGYSLEEEPYFNRYALYVTMSMIMSDSFSSISKFVGSDKVFDFVYALAIDKLKDKDQVFNVRSYFGL